MDCKDKFRSLYHREPESVAFCPYRICPIGAHSDHNLGKITGLAIDKGIRIAYSPKLNGVVELCSLQFDKRAQWHVLQVSQKKENDWADYLRGATLLLSSRFPLKRGISGVIEGSLPIGGLSSSAAVVLAFLEAICDVNCISLTPLEMIQISVQVENEYVGVSCGKLDQSCEVFSKKDRLLYLDTRDDSYELIPFGQTNPDPEMCRKPLPFDIAIFFSGLERNLSGSRFNQRVDEARSAAYALMAYDGRDYGKFKETNLRDIPVETFMKYRDRMPENWAKRADHWYSEFDRVQKGAEAWRKGDILEYGRLSFESGHSSIYNWETGSPELKALYEIMTHTDGIYGGRFSGAGFKGCCMALIDPRYAESIERSVTREYLRLFPELRGKYSFHLCHSADGLDF
ncbi:MAG: galactokinase [Bacteroidales bacterium]|nr:galactokinase [Candidatus Cryptobacteroides onthequi]